MFRRRGFRVAVAALLGAVVMGTVALAVIAHATDGDIGPVGSTCGYETDPGSGVGAYGTEEWRGGLLGLFPERVCLDDEGESRVLPGSQILFAAAVGMTAVGAGAVLGGLIELWRTRHRMAT